MADDKATAHSVAELVTRRRHAGDFTASRADYIAGRLRPLALALAVLLPIWIPVDYLVLPNADFLPLAGLRLAMGALALVLYFLSHPGAGFAATLSRLALLVAAPAVLYVAARLLLPAGGDGLLYGYAFFPVLIVAMVAVFPLTLLEGAALLLPVLLGYGGLEFGLAGVEPGWLGMLWLISLVAVVSLWTQLSQLRMLLDLYRRATRDTLTGVLNRPSLAERLEAEHARSQRYGRPLALMLIELGGLERIARDHGHPVANRLLAQLSDLVGRALRPTDLIGRWDTDTLLVVLPETDHDTSQRLVARVNEVVELANIQITPGTTVRGEPRIALAMPTGQERLDDLLARMDRKLAGRGRVAVAV